jgi:hypothetical protein
MRRLVSATCITLRFCLLTDRVPFVAPATAETQTKPQAQSREALYVKCRNAIFRKHGQPGVQYNHGPRYLVLPYTADSWIDKCVASGGRDY